MTIYYSLTKCLNHSVVIMTEQPTNDMNEKKKNISKLWHSYLVLLSLKGMPANFLVFTYPKKETVIVHNWYMNL